MKEIMGKTHQHNKAKRPRKLFVDKIYITLKTEIVKKFNEFFTEIGPSLARKIPTPSKHFERFLKNASTTLPERCPTTSELTGAFFSLKMNKSTGAGEISFNVIKNCFEELRDILRYVFDLTLETGIFPDPLKIAKMTLVFKTGDLKAINSYCPSLFCRFFDNIIAYYAQPPL